MRLHASGAAGPIGIGAGQSRLKLEVWKAARHLLELRAIHQAMLVAHSEDECKRGRRRVKMGVKDGAEWGNARSGGDQNRFARRIAQHELTERRTYVDHASGGELKQMR